MTVTIDALEKLLRARNPELRLLYFGGEWEATICHQGMVVNTAKADSMERAALKVLAAPPLHK